MTTIIIVVVVALVFFVTVCVVTFMVWKRETEMRTDSIRSIEASLEKLGNKLIGEIERRERGVPETGAVEQTREADSPRELPRRRKKRDPFQWVREEFAAGEKPRQADVHQQECDDEGKKPAGEPEQDPMERARRLMQELEAIREELPKASPEPLQEPSQEPPPEQEEAAGETSLGFADDIYAEAAESEAEAEEDALPCEDEEDAPPGDDEQETLALDEFSEAMNAVPEETAADDEEAGPAQQDTPGAIGRSGKKYTAEELEELIKE